MWSTEERSETSKRQPSMENIGPYNRSRKVLHADRHVRRLRHLAEVRGAEAGDGVPALGRIPASIRHDGATIRSAIEATLAITAGTTAQGDIVEGIVVGVQPGVEEAKRGLSLFDAGVVEQGNDAGEGRGRGRGTVDLGQATLFEDSEVPALGGNVGERTALWIELAGPLVAERGQVGADGLLLPPRTLPEVREAAGREEHALLGESAGRGADRGDPGAGGGELGREVGGVLAVVGLARGPDARVARGEDDGDTAATELANEVAHAAGIFLGDTLDGR